MYRNRDKYNVYVKSDWLLPALFLIIFFHENCQQAAQKVEERVEHFETGAVSRRVMLVEGKRDGKMLSLIHI